MNIDSAQAELDLVSSAFDPTIDLYLRGERVDRAMEGLEHSRDDSSATLRIVQDLFDFGSRSEMKKARSVGLQRARKQLDQELQKNRLLILQRYLEVLLADLDYGVKNEEMTVDFLRFSRLQEGYTDFGTYTQVEVLESQAKYQAAFVIRQKANYERQASRRRLANAMGLEDYVPRDLTLPDLSEFLERELPEYNDLLAKVLDANPELEIAKLQVQEAIHTAGSREAKFKPSVQGIIEGKKWQQPIGTRDEATVAIELRVPLYAGSEKRVTQQRNRIAVEQSYANLTSIEFDLRETTLQLWLELNELSTSSVAADVATEYRDYYLDRSRTLYELEVKSDLGDAQAKLLGALRDKSQVDFQTVLVWTQLDLLMGKQVFSHEN